MKVDRLPTDQGMQLTVRDAGNEMLKANISGNPDAPGVTVYWRGRVDLSRAFAFFIENCPQTESPLFEALVFQPDRHVRVGPFATVRELKDGLPENVCFVRLEHANATRPVSSSVDFVMWSHVDLQDAPRDEPSPDYIGVSTLPDWMKTITNPLVGFVASTHTATVRPNAILDSVQKVLHDISPT